MNTAADNDARMQELYRQKAEMFAKLNTLAGGDADVDKSAMREALAALKSADDELNALTEEMFYTVLTDLRR